MDDFAQTASAPPVLHGERIIQAIKNAKIQYILSVPDLHTAKGLLAPISKDPDLKLIRVCKEDETLGISAGLRYGDIRSLILIQYTGFLYAMNAIRGVAMEQNQPAIFMIGLLGKEAGVEPQKSKQYGVRIVEPILDILGLKRILIETDNDVRLIAPAIEEACANSKSVAFLIGGSPL